jgi:predicted DNA binding protein
MLLNIKLHHYGDWTELTEKYQLTVNNPYFIPLQGEGLNFEVFRINKRLDDTIKSFISDLRSRYRDVVRIISVNPGKNFTDIVLYADYKFSVKSVFVDSRIFIESSKYSDGFEYFTVAIPGNRSGKVIGEVVSRLREKAYVASLTYSRVGERRVRGGGLTLMERVVLTKAIELGYFNYPRGVGLGELARELGLSKATVDFHLRNAVRKVMSRCFNDDQ